MGSRVLHGWVAMLLVAMGWLVETLVPLLLSQHIDILCIRMNTYSQTLVWVSEALAFRFAFNRCSFDLRPTLIHNWQSHCHWGIDVGNGMGFGRLIQD